jgi:hypothetical protein
MPGVSSGRWLVVLTVLLAAAAGGRLARSGVASWTLRRLAGHQQHQVAAAVESVAVQTIRRLAQDDQWLEVIVAATADSRPAVAAAAQAEVLHRMERWQRLPAAESSPHVARLASALAAVAPRLPGEGRRFAHSLAQRLLLWPVDGRAIDAASLIGDCQTVLDLAQGDWPADEPPEWEVAAVPANPPPAAPLTAPAATPRAEPLTETPPGSPPQNAASQTDWPPHEANAAKPPEPRRFAVPPRGTRISDE